MHLLSQIVLIPSDLTQHFLRKKIIDLKIYFTQPFFLEALASLEVVLVIAITSPKYEPSIAITSPKCKSHFCSEV